MTHVMNFGHRFPFFFSQLTDGVPAATTLVYECQNTKQTEDFLTVYCFMMNYKTTILSIPSSPELSSEQKRFSTTHVD